ncbi:MAG: adenosylcobalamin-dependent ribonucleoside-diphosphate reductase [Candidatus Komeilibacteria bacterium]|jgi:ribonucleoside-diphosphate reductase alpha chain|nr:adenosylcobalamin-dependent ribonucleoside-diphosphate reductase [Candidatus Komeilibacteria bacterium]MBT4447355.1 adenosylcobalamin-dependent ribonucleoside-diphosphate reductase [Candidatus Komeilibacteria bacterium]
MQLKEIRKRDGRTENFDQSKLISSLSQAITSTGLKDNPISGKLAKQVTKYLEENYSADQTVTTDDIRNAVNIALLDNNHIEVAKIYFKTRGKKLVKEKNMASGVRQIKKRDGSVVDFDKDKIFSALFKSGQTSGEYNRQEAQRLADVVTAILEHKFNDRLTPNVEQIQDIIEIILIQSNWASTAKHFILYREQRKKIRLEEGKQITSEEVKKLQEAGVNLSKQAKHIINNSTNFDELGRIIFLDRYSIKDKRDDINVGDLVIVITKEDRKYPKKDLGIIKEMITADKAKLHMLTGIYADKENNFEFEQEIFKCDKPREAISDAHRRIAKAVASVETTEENKTKYFEDFFEALDKKYIQPGGRIMTGANVDPHGNYTGNLTLFNCYVLPSPLDSRKAIVKDSLHQMVEVMSRGGGVGMTLSALRPRYAYVKGVHGKSSGSVSWAGLFSYATGLIEQGGSRRGALMLMQWDWHPDVIEFISAKTVAGQIENANISIMISDGFMEAVKNDSNWDLEFPDYEDPAYSDIYDQQWTGDLEAWKEAGFPTKVYKTIKARDLWNKLVASAHASAEPGIVFMERYNKESNSYYFNKVICTNPCGEQGLPGWGVCNLGHLYLASFLDENGQDELGPTYEVNWEELKKAARTLSRFLDNIIDLTPYHFQENEDNQKNERRVGGGTLGLGEMLIKLRMRYGSDESLVFIDELYKAITSEMYKESSRIAAEKGAFPKFNADKFLDSGFMKKMPEDVRQMVRENGIRNVALTTQAPTGTVGSMLSTSTGIEPYYAFKFYRQSRLGFHEVLIPLAQEYKSNGSLPKFFVSAMELDPLEHVKVQAAVQKWTDSSISKTANAPADYTIEQTAQLYEKAYELGCKGVTIYRDSSRDEQVLTTEADTEEKNLAYNGDREVTKQEQMEPFKEAVKEEITEMQNPRKHADIELPEDDDANYGTAVGQTCPQCKKGIMVKFGGCTECSKQCGMKGACDMK